MLEIGDTVPAFEIAGVQPGLNSRQEDRESAFETKRNTDVHASPCGQIPQCPFRRNAHDA
jgi:hypothetical protein